LQTSIGQLNNNLTALSGLITDFIDATNTNNNNNEEGAQPQQTSINNVANVNISATGGGNEQADQLLSRISDALKSLDYKVSAIQKSTKTVIAPQTNNPFSSINNGSISLE